jgi:hypothetical protein
VSDGEAAARIVQFGFPEIWERIYASYQGFFEATKELEKLTEQILQAAQPKALAPAEKTVFVLARLTAIGMTELLVLASNGCGQGAMKIARGMFESALYAEYLRQHPEEAEGLCRLQPSRDVETPPVAPEEFAGSCKANRPRGGRGGGR